MLKSSKVLRTCKFSTEIFYPYIRRSYAGYMSI